MKKLLLTGASGFIGQNLLPVLKDKYDVFAMSSKNYDLLDFKQAENMFLDTKPEIVVHLASKTGGILANKQAPAEFWFKNMMITTHIFELCKNFSVQKLVFFLPGCCYPEFAPNPIEEHDIWDGFPDIYPSSGSLPKKMSIIASYAYKTQFGMNSTIVIPANAYGKHDNFDLNHSHVIPAMLVKMHNAKKDNQKEIVMWGTGEPLRDFVYVEDVVNCVPYFIENSIDFPCDNPCLRNICNLSSDRGTSIKELAETIKEVVGYSGNIIWDTSKPNGPMKKVFSNKRMKSLNLSCSTSLKDGLQKTYKWYEETHSW
jgi:GDP-L-fucose synthase